MRDTKSSVCCASMEVGQLALYGLTLRQASILQILGATAEGVNAYKIAKWTVIEPHTISSLLNRMEADGLIKKTGVKEGGRRALKLELTDKGWEARNKAMRFESIPKVMEVLTDQDGKKLSSILKKLRGEALKQIGIRSKMPFPPY